MEEGISGSSLHLLIWNAAFSIASYPMRYGGSRVLKANYFGDTDFFECFHSMGSNPSIISRNIFVGQTSDSLKDQMKDW